MSQDKLLEVLAKLSKQQLAVVVRIAKDMLANDQDDIADNADQRLVVCNMRQKCKVIQDFEINIQQGICGADQCWHSLPHTQITACSVPCAHYPDAKCVEIDEGTTP